MLPLLVDEQTEGLPMMIKVKTLVEIRDMLAHKVEHRYGVTLAGTHATYCVVEFLDGHTVMVALALIMAVLIIAGIILGLHE